MHIVATLLFQNALAHYHIVEEEEGVFLARLQHYGGLAGEAPPAKILLMRGVRRWIGSFDNQEVLDALGRAVDTLPAPGFSTISSPENHTQQQE